MDPLESLEGRKNLILLAPFSVLYNELYGLEYKRYDKQSFYQESEKTY